MELPQQVREDLELLQPPVLIRCQMHQYSRRGQQVKMRTTEVLLIYPDHHYFGQGGVVSFLMKLTA